MLVGAVSAAIANVEVTVGRGGVTVRTGWAAAAPDARRATAGIERRVRARLRAPCGARAAAGEVASPVGSAASTTAAPRTRQIAGRMSDAELVRLVPSDDRARARNASRACSRVGSCRSTATCDGVRRHRLRAARPRHGQLQRTARRNVPAAAGARGSRHARRPATVVGSADQAFRGVDCEERITVRDDAGAGGHAACWSSPRHRQDRGATPRAQRRRNQIRIMEGVFVQAVGWAPRTSAGTMAQEFDAGRIVACCRRAARARLHPRRPRRLLRRRDSGHEPEPGLVGDDGAARSPDGRRDRLAADRARRRCRRGRRCSRRRWRLQADREARSVPSRRRRRRRRRARSMQPEPAPAPVSRAAATPMLNPEAHVPRGGQERAGRRHARPQPAMRLGADEWLTVAARDNDGAMSGPLADSVHDHDARQGQRPGVVSRRRRRDSRRDPRQGEGRGRVF